MAFVFTQLDRGDEPDYPHAVLTSHVLTKGLQAGSFLGLLITPVVCTVRKRPILPTTLKWTGRGALLGCGLTGAMLAHKYLTFEDRTADAALDRAFRIKHHQMQTRTDVFSLCGGTLGAACGAALGVSAWGLACVGIALGCLVHAGTSPVVALDQSLQDKKRAWKESLQKMK